MGILATYRAYRDYEPQYTDWNNRRNIDDSKRKILNNNNNNIDKNTVNLAQKKARVVADSMLLLDNYAQTKAEDVEAVFQTVQIELLAGLSAIIALPTFITSLIPRLEKHKAKSPVIEKALKHLDNYKNANLKIGKFNLSANKIVTAAVAVASAFVYVPAVTDAVINQIGATRRAKFEGMNKELSNIKDFAILTEEQEREAQAIKNSFKKPAKKSDESLSKMNQFVSDAVHRVNISESINCVNQLMKDKNAYVNTKHKYDESLKDCEKDFDNLLCPEEIATAKADKQLFENIIKKVDLESQDPLEKIEKVINVGYSSLFVGGYLEYLVSDKLIEAMKVKNPILKKVLGFGVPLVTYMVLNKNLANLQNSAIKAVRYKKINEFVADKNNFNTYSQEQLDETPEDSIKKETPKKENIFQFLKNISKDIKEYKAYQRSTFLDNKEYIKAKRQINLTPEQEQDAKHLQRNAFMTINKVDDKNQKYSESVEALSEIVLAPIEILSTASGALMGNKIAAKVETTKFKGLFTVVGALIGFIPSALTELYTTGLQRNSLRISSMLASKELDDYRQFVNYDNKSFKQQAGSAFAFSSRNLPTPFIAFQKKFNKD